MVKIVISSHAYHDRNVGQSPSLRRYHKLCDHRFIKQILYSKQCMSRFNKGPDPLWGQLVCWCSESESATTDYIRAENKFLCISWLLSLQVNKPRSLFVKPQLSMKYFTNKPTQCNTLLFHRIHQSLSESQSNLHKNANSETQKHMFWRLCIFHRHSTREPALIKSR